MKDNRFGKISFVISSLLVFIFFILLIIFPKESMQSALSGVRLWLGTVFPSLLPFFIGSELLMQYGIVNFIGDILEPVMRPIFNVPGAGSFAMAMGFTSGYPMGTKVISRMREQKMCSKIEAERLMSFCNNSGPLFMIGAVGTGMLKSASIGYFIIIANYLGALTVGLLFRYYKKENYKVRNKKLNIKKAFNNMINLRKNDKRKFGEILSDSISDSVKTIIMVGGFIIFFSVIINLLNKLKIIYYLSAGLCVLFPYIFKDINVVSSFLNGIIEMTVGTYNISISDTLLSTKIIISCMVIAWGGLSVHAQIAGIISKTDISYIPFFISKLLQTIFTFFYSIILFHFIGNIMTISTISMYPNSFITGFKFSTLLFLFTLSGIFIVLIFYTIIHSLSS